MRAHAAACNMACSGAGPAWPLRRSPRRRARCRGIPAPGTFPAGDYKRQGDACRACAHGAGGVRGRGKDRQAATNAPACGRRAPGAGWGGVRRAMPSECIMTCCIDSEPCSLHNDIGRERCVWVWVRAGACGALRQTHRRQAPAPISLAHRPRGPARFHCTLLC